MTIIKNTGWLESGPSWVRVPALKPLTHWKCNRDEMVMVQHDGSDAIVEEQLA